MNRTSLTGRATGRRVVARDWLVLGAFLALPWSGFPAPLPDIFAYRADDPVSLRLDRLVSWRKLPELRHYAGSATSTTEFDVPPDCLAGHVAWHLDLGEVFELARVTLNDRDIGTVRLSRDGGRGWGEPEMTALWLFDEPVGYLSQHDSPCASTARSTRPSTRSKGMWICHGYSRRGFLPLGVTACALGLLPACRSMGTARDAGSRLERLFFTSQGRTGVINADGTGWKAALHWTLVYLASTCLLRPAEAPEVSFEHAVIDAKPPQNPWIKIVGDLNGDGKPDLIIGGAKGPLVWYRNPDWQKFPIGSGGYSTVAGSVVDIDGDGDLDVALGGVVWFENPGPKGDPAKDPWPVHEVDKRRGHDLLAADLDGDGKVDLIMRDQSSFGAKAGHSIFLYKQITPMQWAMGELRCGEGEGICVADLNGDGKPDIVIGGTWFENSGELLKGPWTEHLFTTEWKYPHSKVAIGDLNGDGRLDILLAPAELQGGTHRLAWYEAPADPKDGNWKQHSIEEPVETVIHALAVAHFNRDRRLDLVAARMHQGKSPQEVVVYVNAGGGLTWKRQVIATTGSHDVVAADVEGDGLPDILGAHHGGPFHPVELWLNRTAVCAPVSGPLRALPSNPRYLTDDGRRAVYLTGSHTWDNLQDMSEADRPAAFDFNAYLDFLAKHDHNFIRLWRWELVSWDTSANDEKTARHLVAAPHPWARTGPGQALDGKPKFNLDQFDDAYLQRLRSRVAAARDRGIYVSVMLFEGWGVQHVTNAWKAHPLHPDNNVNGLDGDADGDGRGMEVHTVRVAAVTKIQEAYVRKVVDTVNDLDNVLYEISNEAGAYSTDWQEHFIRFVHDYEKGKPKQHPVGMTFQYARDSKPRGSNTNLFRSSAEWISPNPDATPFNYRTNPPPAEGRKVILTDTDHLWGIGGDVAWVWKSLLRGLNPLFMDPYKQEVLQGGADSKWEPVCRAMGVTRRLADRVNLAAMTPHGELASSGYCLASPGKDYLIYVPGGGEVTVDLSAAAGELQIEWIHPVEGKVTPGQATNAGASQILKAPFPGEAVAHLWSR